MSGTEGVSAFFPASVANVAGSVTVQRGWVAVCNPVASNTGGPRQSSCSMGRLVFSRRLCRPASRKVDERKWRGLVSTAENPGRRLRPLNAVGVVRLAFAASR